jgi:hypothetical protein
MNTSRSAEEGKVNQGKDGQDSSTLKKKDEYRMAYTQLLVMTMSWIF